MTTLNLADLAAAPTTDSGSQMHDLLIQQVTLEADGVVSVRLVDPVGQPLPRWEPGAHLDVVMPSGLIRQYSLCGDPEDRYGYTIAVLKEPDGRGGSREMHACALAGNTLHVRGPRNHFTLEPAPRYLFIAGGIGITPILAMVRQAVRTTVPWSLVYGGRSLRSMAFRADIEAMAGDRATLVPQDTAGMLDLDQLFSELDPATHVYCCGPSGLIEAVEARSRQFLPDNALHVERFTAGAAERTETPAANTGFEVELRRTGCTVNVPPGTTIVEAIRDLAPGLMTSCEEGFCGTCETKVLEGTPEHHDTILSAAERERGKTMMVCVGRSLSPRLVLDL